MIDVPGREASSEELSRFLLALLAEAGLDGVLVGTNAAIATGAMNVASKDADAVVISRLRPPAIRRRLQRVAEDSELAIEDAGWGVLKIAPCARSAQAFPWTVDAIVPSSGMIPPPAAKRIEARAIATSVGRAACHEHLIAMKAVAAVDRAQEGQTALAVKYEQHLEMLAARRRGDIEWPWVQELLQAYVARRRDPAAELISSVFGTDPRAHRRR